MKIKKVRANCIKRDEIRFGRAPDESGSRAMLKWRMYLRHNRFARSRGECITCRPYTQVRTDYAINETCFDANRPHTIEIFVNPTQQKSP